MTAPRVEIDLAKIRHNASVLVERLALRGISVTAVTKATLGSPDIANELVRAGIGALGDSRIENIELLRHAGVASTMTLIRSPMLSQVARVVEHADVSLNTEPAVIRALSSVAQVMGRTHGIVLMVELGDLREGIMPADLDEVVVEVLALPGLVLRGIGTNLACQNGVVPDATNMSRLSTLVGSIEATFSITLDLVSGGNSATLDWALGGNDTGRVNDLRLGEAILLGREPLHRTPIDGLHLDAFTLVAEVIESKAKPSLPWGPRAQNAMGQTSTALDRGDLTRAIVAIGHQDVDPSGLEPPADVEILGASSDHLVVSAAAPLPIGSELSFRLGYGALVRVMTSPFVAKVMNHPVEARHLAVVPRGR